MHKFVHTSWPLLVAAMIGAGVITRDSVRSVSGDERVAVVASRPASLIQKSERVAWVGSSSTKIGVWPKTVEFLIRTRHPRLGVTFRSFSTGGGTFQTALEHLDGWLEEARPSLVVLNYGGNDAGSGFHGLDAFRDRMERCVAKIQARGARSVLVTPQAADPRKSGRESAAKRALFADVMLEHGRERGWPVIDVHEPLDSLQRVGQRDDPSYSILKDKIHLTDRAYVAWGFYFYDRLDLPRTMSAATLGASGRVVWTSGCEIRDVQTCDGVLSFTRIDHVLPILPPVPLPPRHGVPLESLSPYSLRVVGLEPGSYEVVCDGKPIGEADDESLRLGVNLNTLLIESGREAPWTSLAKAIWDGQTLDQSGGASWRFEIRKATGAGAVVAED